MRYLFENVGKFNLSTKLGNFFHFDNSNSNNKVEYHIHFHLPDKKNKRLKSKN